uniref:Uncharacterized protein n=1 Tax=Meloidogyne enterolobii TaxID=390850 RepID=A0A6V7WVI7_MELEN|nr:unnamed protein product [Meloidogyne enterolobii]
MTSDRCDEKIPLYTFTLHTFPIRGLYNIVMLDPALINDQNIPIICFVTDILSKNSKLLSLIITKHFNIFNII